MSYSIKDYMDRTFPTIDLDASIYTAAQIIAEGNQEFLVVLEKGMPKGMICSLDIVSNVVAKALDAGRTKVKEIMTPLTTVEPEEDLMKASEIMLKKGLSRLAVVKQGIVYGIVTAQGIAEKCPAYIDKVVKDIFRWSLPSR